MVEPDGDISGILQASLHLELVGCGRYFVQGETAELIVLEAKDGLRIDKRDPRLRGSHVAWVRYAGAIVRIAAVRGDLSLVVAHGISLAPNLGFSWGETYRRLIGFRWVRSEALEHLDLRGFDLWPPNAPVLDDAFRRAIGAYAHLRDSTGTLRIVGESSDAFTVEPALLILKGDPAVTGAHEAIASYAGHLVRIGGELPSHVLAVAHSSLGRELSFAVLSSSDQEVSGRWIPRSELEVTALTGARRTRVPSALLPLARRGRVTFEGAHAPDGFGVGEEAPDSIVITYEEPVERPDLVALGFQQRFVEERGLHVYLQTVLKTDPRLGGFDGLVEHAGYRLRVVERDDVRAFVVASALRAHMLGLERDDETASGWVPDLGDAASRPLLDESAIADLATHHEVHHVSLGRALLVRAESTDTLTLEYHSETGEDAELIGAGFRCERSEIVERWGEDHVRWEHTVTVPKHASSISGPFGRWVRYRGSPMRAIREHGDHLLLVAHPGFGKALGFATVAPDGVFIQVSCRWVRRDDCEPV